MIKHTVLGLLFILPVLFTGTAYAQQKVLTMPEAMQMALANYGTLRAKANYVNASKASVTGTRREYLPDFSLSAQQDYGTINGQSGPLYGYRGLSVSSGGPALASQSWATAFGALYLANINWDFYSFGKVRERIKIAELTLQRDEDDLEQEKFEHQVRVAAAYLNLLAAQRFIRSWENNLQRASALGTIVVARTKNGLNAGVDSSLSNAEISSAKIALVRARDAEQEQENALAQLLGTESQTFVLDTLFLSRIPASIGDEAHAGGQVHPVLQYYRRLVDLSNLQEKYYRTFNYPTFSIFGVMQSRGSGFGYNYGTQNPKAYSKKYWEGINPNRSNYLAGIGMIWNLTTPLRIRQQTAAQRFTSLALQNDYDQVALELHNQLILANNKIANAMENYREAPIQIKAAGDAYTQKSVLYKNGLSNIVDVTQALYTLNRAETDRDIAYNNVWQALLLKAAASGDFGLFINAF